MTKLVEKLTCITCNYATNDINSYISHYLTDNNHILDKNPTTKLKLHNCVSCNYKTDKKHDFIKHLLTSKHKNNQSNSYISNFNHMNFCISNDNKEHCMTEKPHVCMVCGKKYKHQSSLSRHIKTCSVSNSKKKMVANDNNIQMTTNDNIQPPKKQLFVDYSNHIKKKQLQCKCCGKIYKYPSGLSRHMQTCTQKPKSQEYTNAVLTQNTKNDLSMQELLVKCFDMMSEQNQTMRKLIPKIGNNNNNTTTNRFNLNVYLNETCKDAVNLPEFISNITLELSDLLHARKNGLLTSTTNVFLKELQSTEPVHRPIQCTDIKRKTMYIKEAGEWSKDIGNEKLKRAMNSISQKHMHLINDWKENNPNHMDNENGQEEFVKIIQTATKDINNDTRGLQSAVKEIGETVQVSPQIENVTETI